MRGREGGRLVAFYRVQERVVGAVAIDRPRDFAGARKLVAAKAVIPAELLGDEATPIAELAASG